MNSDHILAYIFFPLLWVWAFTLQPKSKKPPQPAAAAPARPSVNDIYYESEYE